MIACVFAAALFLLGSVQDGAAQPADSGIPLTYDDSTYVLVPVTAGTQDAAGTQDSLLFVLDTAAYTTVVAPWVGDALGLPASAADTMTVTGAGGRRTVPTLRLGPLRVGEHAVPGLTVPVIDLAPLERSGVRYAGILGNDVLKRFDVAYDLPNRRLRLHPIAAGSAPIAGLDTLRRVPFEDVYGGAAGFVTVRLTIGDGEAEAVLDTGAPQSILNWKAAGLDGLAPETVQQPPSQIQGIDLGAAVDTYLHSVSDVRLGPVPLQPAEVRVADLPVFRALGLADRPAVILGNDLLAGRTLVIAYSTGHLYLSPPSAPPQP